MSSSAGILALAVWLCPNEVSVNGFLLCQIRSPEARLKYVDKGQDDSLNELKLEISQFRYADTNLVIRCDHLPSPVMSGLFSFPSGLRCSNVKPLSRSLLSRRRQYQAAECHILPNKYLFSSPGRTFTLFSDAVSEAAQTGTQALGALTQTRMQATLRCPHSRAPGDAIERDR